MPDESSNLALWSTAVRESTLKRLRAVPPQKEEWRPILGAMSFADIAQHILDSDVWLFKKLEDPTLQPIQGSAGTTHIATREEYLEILSRLEQTGSQRAELVRSLTSAQMDERIPDERFGGEASVWWVIVRGNLDHETHHRGQLAAYLRIALVAR